MSCLDLFQGLAPLAIDLRPSGAGEGPSRGAHSQRPRVFDGFLALSRVIVIIQRPDRRLGHREEILGKVPGPFLAPTGRHMTAQGNALGKSARSPVSALQGRYRRSRVAALPSAPRILGSSPPERCPTLFRPFRANWGARGRPVPRALPWAFLSCPFRAEEPGRDLLVSRRNPRHSSLLSGRCFY